MDLFFTFLFLFLTLFAIKIYLIHKKTKEGFKFHRRKHNQRPNTPHKKTEKMKVNKKQTNGEQTKEEEEQKQDNTLVENMDMPELNMPDPFEEIEKIMNDFENLDDVYERNAEGYPGSLGSVDGPIPNIPEIPELDIGLPFPLEFITEPLEQIVNFFIDASNTYIEFYNIIIDIINICIHYSTCAFTLLVNFFTVPCVFWYILNMIIAIIYLPFSFIFWLLGITDIIENYVWGPIYIADEVLHDYTGFHFAHFPESIIKGCYSCPAEFEVMGMSSFSLIGDMFKSALNLFPDND